MHTLKRLYLSCPSVTRIRTIRLAADLGLSVVTHYGDDASADPQAGIHLDVIDYEFRGP
jgi:hypothetical protein